ncbi:uncharacterized protein LOC117640560 isoform X2 [Thrips palmi]|uniref:Uncharacterized protein LOC117640560 isoform X2 n=1 Tax=Thrips palmi TaxID=161013 RepID=A0A6P8YGB2_THRPL|nr:uncharacterized protein LOC117640560 isoform X2 [Thrips palmi]
MYGFLRSWSNVLQFFQGWIFTHEEQYKVKVPAVFGEKNFQATLTAAKEKKQRAADGLIEDLHLEFGAEFFFTLLLNTHFSIPSIMVHFCSVAHCKGKWRSGSKHLRFHSFPKDEETCKLWQKAVGRLNPPSNSMKVCSRHFSEDDYQIFLPGCKRLKKSAVPSVYLPSKVDAFSQTDDCDGMINVCSMSQLCSSFEMEYDPQRCPTPTPESPQFSEENFLNVAIKEEIDLIPSMQLITRESSGEIRFSQPEPNDILLNDFEFDFLSGISKNCFQSLFALLTTESLTLPSCNMSAKNQLLLTLCKYKYNLPYPILNIIFKIKDSDALAVFSFWTYHIFKTLKLNSLVDVKPEKSLQQSVSVGFLKIPVLEPSSPCAHQHEHSYSESCPYLKSLVVIDDDSQLILYCSKLYGVFTRDESMLLDKEFQQCLAASTSIKWYGDFNLSQLFPDKDIEVVISDNISSCLCRKRHDYGAVCASSSVLLTKQFQNLMAFFKILSEGLPYGLLIISSEIVFNCMTIFNFRSGSTEN